MSATQELIDQKKQRGERFGNTYTTTADDEKALRAARFASTEEQPKTERSNVDLDASLSDLIKSGKKQRLADKKQKKATPTAKTTPQKSKKQPQQQQQQQTRSPAKKLTQSPRGGAARPKEPKPSQLHTKQQQQQRKGRGSLTQDVSAARLSSTGGRKSSLGGKTGQKSPAKGGKSKMSADTILAMVDPRAHEEMQARKARFQAE